MTNALSAARNLLASISGSPKKNRRKKFSGEKMMS
jgi:hypothetical protein